MNPHFWLNLIRYEEHYIAYNGTAKKKVAMSNLFYSDVYYRLLIYNVTSNPNLISRYSGLVHIVFTPFVKNYR